MSTILKIKDSSGNIHALQPGKELEIKQLIDNGDGTFTVDANTLDGPILLEQQSDIPSETSGYGTLYIKEGGNAAIDSDTVFMLESNSTHLDSTVADISPSAHSITNNLVAHSNSRPLVGGETSLYFDGNDSLTMSSHTDFDLAPIFTIDFWISFYSLPPTDDYTVICSREQDANNRWQIIADKRSKSTIALQWCVAGVWETIEADVAWADSQWYNIAFTYNALDGQVYVNGLLEHEETLTTVFPALTGDFVIGKSVLDGKGYDGFIEEFRVSKMQRFTDNFVPHTTLLSATTTRESVNIVTSDGKQVELLDTRDLPDFLLKSIYDSDSDGRIDYANALRDVDNLYTKSAQAVQEHINSSDDPHQTISAAGTINSFAEKGTPISDDILLLEDSEDSYNKKHVHIGNLPTSDTLIIPNRQEAPTEVPYHGIIYIEGDNPNGPMEDTVKLLLQSDTTDGSTVFTDRSESEHSVTNGGAVVHSISKSKFGESSIYFNNTSTAYLQYVNHADFNLGTDDFTIDFWVMFNSLSAWDAIWSLRSTGASTEPIAYINGSNNLSIWFGGDMACITSPALNTWYHIASVRDSGTITNYVNGTEVSTKTLASISYSNNGMILGAWSTGDKGSNPDIYLDEFRWVKGEAKWTDDFTPPTTKYYPPAGIPQSLKYLDGSGTDVEIITSNNIPMPDTLVIPNRETTPSTEPYHGILYVKGNSNTIESVTKLYIKSDHSNNSTDISDLSQSEYTITNGGAVVHSTTESKIGTSSLYFDSSATGYLSVASDTNLILGGSDFTIDFWLNVQAWDSWDGIFSFSTQTIATNRLYMDDSNNLIADFYGIQATIITSITTDQWYHIACVLDGTTMRYFVDGTQVDTDTVTITSYDCGLILGGVYTDSPGVYNPEIYIDEFRVVNGEAKYTTAFTPSTTHYYPASPIDQTLQFIHEDGNKVSVTTSQDLSEYLSNVTNDAQLKREAADFVTFDEKETPLAADKLLIEDSEDTNAKKLVQLGNLPAPNIDIISLNNQSTAPIHASGKGKLYTLGSIAGSAIDNDTTLLIHSNTTNGDTVFTDSSPSGHTITRSGSMVHTTTAYKFGSSSMFMDKDRTYWLTVADHTDWTFGSQDFTMDLWFNLSEITGAEQHFMFQYTGASNYWFFQFKENVGLNCFWKNSSGESEGLNEGSSDDYQTGVWYHAAIVRNGNTIKLYRNGSEVASGSITNIVDVGSTVAIGRDFGGYLDEIRISTGVARYTEEFTPLTQPYSEAQDQALKFKYEDGVETDIITSSNIGELSFVEIVERDAAPSSETGKGKFYVLSGAGEGNDSNTTLLIHSDATQGNTNIIDASPSAHTISSNGGSVIHSTAQSYFGSSSLYFNDDTYLTVPTHSDFNIGTNDFTIDFWAYFENAGTMDDGIIEIGGPTNFRIYIASDILTVRILNSNIVTTNVSSYENSWNHFAIVRSGSTVSIYINGTSITSGSNSSSIAQGQIYIGYHYDASYTFLGYLDEFRLSNSARWSTDFTVSDMIYVNPGDSGLRYIDDEGTVTNLLQKHYVAAGIPIASASTYTIESDDEIIHSTYSSTGTQTITIPSSEIYVGRKIIIKDAGGDASTSNITIATESSELIDGSASATISADYGYMTLYSDGTDLFTISYKI